MILFSFMKVFGVLVSLTVSLFNLTVCSLKWHTWNWDTSTPTLASHDLESDTDDSVTPVNDKVNCVCGTTVDDETDMVQCDTYNEWSHCACYNISETTASQIDFEFKSYMGNGLQARTDTNSSDTDNVISPGSHSYPIVIPTLLIMMILP